MFLTVSKEKTYNIRYVKIIKWCLLVVGFALLFILLAGTKNAEADTVVPPGPVCDDFLICPGYAGPWNATGSPYWVEGDIFVPNSVAPQGDPTNTLTIDGSFGPVEIKFNGPYSLKVGIPMAGNPASLRVTGLNKNINFTRNNTGITWLGIEFTDSATPPSIIDGAIIEYTSGGPDVAVWLNGPTGIVIINSEIREVNGMTQAVGIGLYNGTGVLNTDNNFIINNFIHNVSIPVPTPFIASGISLVNASANTINDNTIENISAMGGGGGGGATGIYLKDSSLNTIDPNRIRNIKSDGNIVAGIELFGDCDWNDILYNEIDEVLAFFPGMGEAFGIRLIGDSLAGTTPDRNNISGNTIWDVNSMLSIAYGISISDAVSTTLGNNKVFNSVNGIWVEKGSSVNINNNEIYDNLVWGLYMDKTSSGNWVIDTKAMLANNPMKLNGSIQVNGGKLTLYNIFSSEVDMVSISPGGLLEVGASPASIISQDVWVDGVFYLNSSKWEIDCDTSDGQYGIQVNSTGTMIIQNNGTGPSTVTDGPNDVDNGMSSDYRYYFKVLFGSTFRLLDSEISEVGWTSSPANESALFIQTNDVDIQHSKILRNYDGIYSTGSGWTINDTIFDNLDRIGLILIVANDVVITNCTINTTSAPARGIYSVNSDFLEIIDNTINTLGSSADGLELSSADGCTIKNNDIIADTAYGIRLTSGTLNDVINNTVKNSSIGIQLEDSTRITIKDNTVKDNENGIWFISGSIATLYNNEIYNNKIWGIWMDNTSSGDWYVDDFGSLINNPAKINGSIVVMTGKLTFYNVEAEILNVSIGSFGLMELGASPTSIISNNVWVDGFLYLNSSKWEINVTGVNGSIGIQVNSTGTMMIQDNGTGPSVVTDGPYDTDDMSSNDFRYYFKVLTGASFRLLDSNVNEVGWWDGVASESGLYIDTSDCYINNSNFRRNYYGVAIRTGGWTFENNDLDIMDLKGIWVDQCSDMTIANNTLNGSIGSDSGIHLRFSSNNNIIDNNTVTNFSNGIYLEGSNNNDILNNKVLYNFWGIYLWSSLINDIINNTATENDDHGIYLFGGSNGNFLSENNATDNNFNGIGLRTSDGNTIENNDAILNPGAGIFLWSSDNNNKVSNNTVLNNVQGIFLMDAKSNMVRDNTVLNNTAYGILLTGSSDGNNIINNTVMNDNQGIYITDSNGNYIIDNEVWDNNNEGIILTFGSVGNFIIDNTIWDNGNGINLQDSSATLYNNEIYNNTNLGLSMNPGSSGDWYVDEYALLFNNDGNLNGDLMVLSTGEMLIEKSSLDMEDAFIQSSGLLEVLDSKTSIISWNLTVAGTVTLDNVTWKIDNSDDGEHWINVVDTGTFNVTNDSLITANDPTYHYDFWVDGNATFTDSWIEYVGYNMSSGSIGIYFTTPNVVFNNMVVRHCFAAIGVDGVGFTITNTEIYNCTIGVGLLNSGSGMVLDHVEIHDMLLGSEPWTMGIYAEGHSDLTASNITIYNLPSADFSTGINLDLSTNFVIENSNITNVTGFGIFADNSTGTVNNVYLYNSSVGIQTENSTLSIIDATIFNQTIVGMSIQTNSYVEVIDSFILECQGGIRVAYGSTIYVNSTTIENISVAANTQGISAQEGTAYINDTTILNQSTGVTAMDSSSVTIADSYINDSVSAGIYCEFSVLEMRTTTIYNASFGVYFSNSWGNTIYDSFILNTTQVALAGVASGVTVYDTLFDYNNDAVYSQNSATMMIVNSTISNSTGWDFLFFSDSHVTSLNTTFDNTSVGFGDVDSTLTVQWFLHVKVEGLLAEPIPGANVNITDNANGNYEGNFVTDGGGYVFWIVITDYVVQEFASNKTYYTPYDISAWNATMTGFRLGYIYESMLIIVTLDMPTVTIDYIIIEYFNGALVTDGTILTADDDITVYARGYNYTEGKVGDVSANWVVNGVIGLLSGPTGTTVTFNATTVGIGNISATYNSFSNVTGNITVTPGAVARIELTPWPTTTASTDEVGAFSAVGYDADGNENWTWTTLWSWEGSGLGTLTPIDPFNYTVPYDKVGTDGLNINMVGNPGVYNSTMVTVTAGVVVRIDITPWPNSTATTDDIGAFNLIGYDADDNQNWTWTPSWTWNGLGLGTLTPTDPYNYTVAYDTVGSDTINVTVASDPTIYNTTDVIVDVGQVVRIEITPWPSITNTTDDVGVFSVIGYDADGNENWTWTTLWSWEGSGLGTLTPIDPFNYTVPYDKVGTDGLNINMVGNPGVYNSTMVTVTAGKVVEIIIKPGGPEVNTTDDVLNFVVEGYDADGNLNTSWTPDANWSGPDLGIITISDFNVSVNFTTVGSSAINVFDSADPSVYNDTKSVTVNVGAPYRIVYVSGSGQFGFSGTTLSFPFVVRVEDYDGNPVPNIEINWTLDDWPSGASGQSLSDYNSLTNTTGEATTTLTLGDKAGIYNVSAANLTLSLVGEPVLFNASATIYTIDEIWITDGLGTPITDMTLSADDTLDLYAWAYNETGGILGLMAVNWSSDGGIGTFTTSTLLQTNATFDLITVGIGNITVEFENATVTIYNTTGDITVIPGAVANIVITPSSATNTTDDSEVFRVVGYDADGNENWTWNTVWAWEGTILGSLSMIDDYNYTVSYHTVGTDAIRVSVSGDPSVFDSASVTVNPGQVARIEITPWPNSTATTDDIGAFSIIGYDADDNVNWTWTPAWTWEGPGLGTLTQTDLYNYTVPYDTVGSDTINVTVSGDPTIYNNTDVRVEVGQVARIEITPWPSTTASIDDVGMFSVVGYDADDNENWTWSPNWSWEGAGLGTLTPTTLYNYSVTFTIAGSDAVNVSVLSDPSIYNTTSVTVTAPVTVDYIVIMDAPGGIGNAVTTLDYSVGDIDTLYAAGFNYTSDYVMDVEVTWTSNNETNATVIAGPSISTTFSANSTHGGEVIITATNSTLTEPSNSTGILTVLDPEVDYIQIRNAAGGAGNIVTTGSYSEGETDTFYAAGYNFTADYIGDVSVTWMSDDTDVGQVVSPGSSTTFTAGTISGTTTVTATYAPGISNMTGTLTVTVGVEPPTIDYIVIMDAPGGAGNAVTDLDFNVDDKVTLYAAGFNYSSGYVTDIEVTWSSSNETNGTVSAGPNISTVFAANDTHGGTVIIMATNSSLPETSNSTGTLTVLDPEVDYIQIRDTAGGTGNIIATGSYSEEQTDMFYAVGYNLTSGLIGDVSVDWISTNIGIGTVSPASGTSTTFTAGTVSGTTTVTATYPVDISNSTGTLTVSVTVIPPTVDYIVIMDAPGGSGNAVTEITMNGGGTGTYYAVGYNATTGEFVRDVSVTWSVTAAAGTIDVTTGYLTNFTASNTTGTNVTGDLTATYNVLSNSTGIFVDLPPSAPTDFEVFQRAEGESLDITWTPSTEPDVDGYIIYRSQTSGSGFSAIETVEGRTNALHTDSGLTDGTTYYYYIVAYDNGPNYSPGSAEASETSDSDTDRDGDFNLIDEDDDNDGLLDTEEDKNGDGILDDDETDPLNEDTDGDGHNDKDDLYPRDPERHEDAFPIMFLILPIIIIIILVILAMALRKREPKEEYPPEEELDEYEEEEMEESEEEEISDDEIEDLDEIEEELGEDLEKDMDLEDDGAIEEEFEGEEEDLDLP